MNKKLLMLGLIVIVGTGFYMNGLMNNNDCFEVTQFGTAFDVPCDAVELIKSENGTDIFGYNQNGQFYYAISFNVSENPDLYMKFNEMICKGKKYEENGVVFYEQTSQVLGNNFNVWTGVNLAIKDQTTAGSFIKNDTTGECIVCISNNWKNVVDSLKDVDWGDKTVASENNVIKNVTSDLNDSTSDNVDETASETTTTQDSNTNDLYESQFNQKDGEPKGEVLNKDYIESTSASNGKELQEYMENNVPDEYK